jgi:hypothetical protein
MLEEISCETIESVNPLKMLGFTVVVTVIKISCGEMGLINNLQKMLNFSVFNIWPQSENNTFLRIESKDSL